MKIDKKAIIEAYINGESLNSLARKFNTYPTSIRRVLERNNVELRHDFIDKGELYVEDGNKLIEWAKAQGRLVTKTELAKVLGKSRLSPSYFIKYPELGQYIQLREQQELQTYSEILYEWLKKNNIQYKPNDRTKLKMSVTALLLGEYKKFIIQIHIKPKCISKKKFEIDTRERIQRALDNDMFIIWVKEEDFKNLDNLKTILDKFKNERNTH